MKLFLTKFTLLAQLHPLKKPRIKGKWVHIRVMKTSKFSKSTSLNMISSDDLWHFKFSFQRHKSFPILTRVALVIAWFWNYTKALWLRIRGTGCQKTIFLKLLYLGVEKSELTSACCVLKLDLNFFLCYEFQRLIQFLWILPHFQTLQKNQDCFCPVLIKHHVWAEIRMIFDWNLRKVSYEKF